MLEVLAIGLGLVLMLADLFVPADAAGSSATRPLWRWACCC